MADGRFITASDSSPRLWKPGVPKAITTRTERTRLHMFSTMKKEKARIIRSVTVEIRLKATICNEEHHKRRKAAWGKARCLQDNSGLTFKKCFIFLKEKHNPTAINYRILGILKYPSVQGSCVLAVRFFFWKSLKPFHFILALQFNDHQH